MKQQLVHPLTLLGLVLLAALPLGCSNNKKQAVPVAPEPIHAGNFARSWAYPIQLKNDSIDRLFVRGDTLFVYTTTTQDVYALGAEGGEFRYYCDPNVSGGVLRPPVVLGDHVIFPLGSTIDIFNKMGHPVRTIALPKPTRSGAAAGSNDRTLYIGLDHTGGTGVIASVDITQPYRVLTWELMTYGAVTPTPVVYDRTIYGGAEDGKLYAVTEERGQVWPLENGVFVTQGKFVSDIHADDYGVYAANTDSKLYCLDRLTGKIKWQFYAGVPLKTDPVVTAQIVYQYVPGMGIVAIDKTTGDLDRRPRWIVKNAVQVLSEDEKNVYLRRHDNRIIAVDKAMGEVQFVSHRTFDVFTTNTQSPVIYVATKDGMVYGIHPVLAEGEVGHQVRGNKRGPGGNGGEFRIETLASAAR